jgi:parallel beta-helix repeat protein
MTSNRQLRRIAITAALGALFALPALAAQRTFVASYGNDSNACSLSAPCRGFAAAIAQTTAGGEVIVLDSAGYGGVTITQSVSIIAPAGIYAGMSVFSGDGITINALASDVVRLRGLRITGLGGARGIVVTSVGFLDIANVEVNGFTGRGLDFSAQDARLSVSESSFANNGEGAHVQSATTRSFATFLRSRFDRNGNGVVISANTFGNISEISASHPAGGSGIYVDQGGVANISDCTITGSDVYGNDYGIYVNNGSTGNVTRCKITGASYGVLGYGAGTKIAVSDTTVVAAGGVVGVGIGASAGATGTVERCTVSGSPHAFSVGAGNSVLNVSNSTAVDNTIDAFFLFAAGSTIYSRSNNTVRGNPSLTTGPGTFTTFTPN